MCLLCRRDDAQVSTDGMAFTPSVQLWRRMFVFAALERSSVACWRSSDYKCHVDRSPSAHSLTGFSFSQKLRANPHANRCIANWRVDSSIVEEGSWVTLTGEQMCQVPIWGGRAVARSISMIQNMKLFSVKIITRELAWHPKLS